MNSNLLLPSRRERGMSLIEITFAILILAITALGIMKSATIAIATMNRTVHHTEANRIASQSMENFYALDPATFVDSTTTDLVTVGAMEFSRTVDIEIDADRTRIVTITVTGTTDKSGGSAELVNEFALRGTR